MTNPSLSAAMALPPLPPGSRACPDCWGEGIPTFEHDSDGNCGAVCPGCGSMPAWMRAKLATGELVIHTPVIADRARSAAVAEGMVLVPMEFVQGFGTLAHNYTMNAEAPDYYHGVERDAFAAAYRRCGNDLAKLRAMLAAATPVAIPKAEGEADELGQRGPADADFPWPKLLKPAHVCGATFGVGVSSRLVVECAQRHAAYRAEEATKTLEQRQRDEANRRSLWDMLNGRTATGNPLKDILDEQAKRTIYKSGEADRVYAGYPICKSAIPGVHTQVCRDAAPAPVAVAAVGASEQAEPLTDARILEVATTLFPRWREDIQQRFVLELARGLDAAKERSNV